MTPTQQSLAFLRGRKYRVAIVEHWNPWARVRQDLFGFIDLLAVHPEYGILGIQTTTKSNLQARVDKALNLESCVDVLRAGMNLEFHGWKGKDVTIQEIVWDSTQQRLQVI